MNRGQHFVCPDEWADGKSWTDYQVDETTVGQYIGVKDNNGQRIFEGDKIAVDYGDGIIAVDTVVWLNAGTEFMAKDDHGAYHVIIGKLAIVIGNIYDKPNI